MAPGDGTPNIHGKKPWNWKTALTSLWGVWLIVTAGTVATITNSGEPGAWNHIPYAIFNVFTPILLGNFDVKRPMIFLPRGDPSVKGEPETVAACEQA